MDRPRTLAKKPTKGGKGHAPPGHLFALGSKSSTETSSKGPASTLAPRKPGSSLTAPGKRDPVPVPGSSLLSKKPKTHGTQYTPLGRSTEGDRGRSSPTTHKYLYEEIAEEVEPHEICDVIIDAVERDDEDRVVPLLCGAVKQLKANRAKPDSALYLSLMYLAKARPPLFQSENVLEAFSSLLKRDMGLSFKAKGNALVSVLACNIMMTAYQDEKIWPENFIKVYLEDSLGERIWVDRSDCKEFVENIQSAFRTKAPKSSAFTDITPTGAPPAGGSPMPTFDDEDSNSSSTGDPLRKEMSTFDDDSASSVTPRYSYQQVNIEMQVLDILRDHLGRRQPMDGGSKNLLRLMTVTAGYTEVRTLGAQRLEMWLQNPKLTRVAQDLLMSVCMNCDQHAHQDVEVMNQLSRIRLKTKNLINHYLLCIRELLNQHADNMRTLMTHTVYNELSTSRNPNNMSLLQVMFNQNPEQSASILAEVFQDLLTNKEDYVRALRALLREIVRAVRPDLVFSQLTLGLMQERTDPKFRDLDQSIKERVFHGITDLITVTGLLSVSSAVKEAASAVARGDQKDLETLRNFQNQMGEIQRDSVWWLQTIVPSTFDIKANEYSHSLRKLLFVEKAEVYHKIDNWPPENERTIALRLVSEVPVLEDTMMRVLVMGLNKGLHISQPDAVDLTDQLIRRAALLYTDDFPVLQVERMDLIDALLNLCAYKHPDNITLPKGYQAPLLAISNLYWKAWNMLLIISAYNTSTFGMVAWDSYPMVRCFMEMAMTNNFKFPPPTTAIDEKSTEEINTREKQIREQEKQLILEFEGHLASSQITESNSLLLSQLTLMEPTGPERKPPATALEQLKILCQSLRIGPLLCKSRSPDFLLDIIEKQGASQSMPWLAELVQSSEGSLDILPVQCLCEFLLHDSHSDNYSHDFDDDDDKGERQKKQQKQRKQEQLLARLQKLLHSENSDARTISEVLNYFLKRLRSSQLSSRQLAVKGLSLVVGRDHIDEERSPMEMEESAAVTVIPSHRWLLEQLPSLPQFDTIKQTTCATLRSACQVETDASAVSAYIIFLAQFSSDLQLQELDELALDMAQLIVERATLMNHLLPTEGNTSKRADLVLASMIDLFFNYLVKAQQPQEEAYSWSNTQDQILLHWQNGKSATMNILVVHAMIILLTYGSPGGVSQFDDMLETWFPADGQPPSAYLVDTSEEALLLPDWLKLRMIRSLVQRLVDAALVDLEPNQLLLFVQSFGIPMNSMCKLLRCLDRAVDIDCYQMEQVVVDKSYMAQLVEVQHMRGATGGHQFHEMLLEESKKEKPKEKPVEEDMEIPPARRERTLSTLSRTPVLPAAQQRDMPSMKEFIIRLFADNLKVEAGERQQMFRSLQKSLMTEDIAGTVIQAFCQVLTSGSGNSVVAGMKKNLHLSSPLLRILLSKKAKNEKDLQKLCSTLQKKLEDSKSALTSIVAGYPKKTATTSHLDVVEKTYNEISKGKKMEATLKKAIETIEAEKIPRGESLVNMCVAKSLSNSTPEDRVKACCHLLLPDKYGVVLPVTTAGLLVDWLQLLDPEIVSTCPELQQKLLFAKEQLGESKAAEAAAAEGTSDERDGGGSGDRAARVSNQPYLLSLLTHQGSWTSIHRCIELLLGRGRDITAMSPSAVLDFLWACIQIPTIWQGRDKKLPKNYKPEDILLLTADQTRMVVKYILQEARNFETEKSSASSSTSSLSENTQKLIGARMPLLLRCCCDKPHLVTAVVHLLTDNIRQNQPTKAESQWLLMEVYINMPHKVGLGEFCSDLPILNNTTIKHKTSSQLDVLTHRVITGLGNTGHGATAENRMYDANIACRKLAANHPLLLLRQLSLISAMLQGRAQFTFGEMRHRNHIFLYTHVLGILELLQPFLYLEEYTTPFASTLAAYFELIKEHCLTNRQLGSIVVKFIKLINNFLSYDAKRSCNILHKYIPVLNELTNLYPDLSVLRSLLAGLTLPRQEGTDAGEDGPESSGTEEEAMTLAPARPTSPWTMAQVSTHLSKIAKDAPKEDVLEVLRDLDETSKRKVDMLDHFMGDLRRLMLDRNETCRTTAHSLVMRYIRHNPSCASDFVGPFSQCLESRQQEIVLSALKNLAEFCLLAQEHASLLLQKAFMIGVWSRTNCETYISDAIQLLNMDTMTV